MTATLIEDFQQITDSVEPRCDGDGCDNTAHWTGRHVNCRLVNLMCGECADLDRWWRRNDRAALTCRICGQRYDGDHIAERIRDFPIEAL